jgi:ABC-type sugar transport systems, permease components
MATMVEAPPPTTRVGRGQRSLTWRNTLHGWSFIAPNFIGFALITMVPIGYLFYVAFTKWSFGRARWVGFDNFERLFNDQRFYTALRNTVYYVVGHVPLTFVVALGLAILLNRRLRGVAFFRTAAFFPYITSIVALAYVWNALFSPDFGPINAFLRFIGIDNPPGWTTDPNWSMPAVILVGTWRDMGYYMLLFLAGLQTIPSQLYEAATVDGASAWQRFWHVTLPGLRHTTFFVLVIMTINSFKVFDLILVLTDGGPGISTLVLSHYIYMKGFEENDPGYAGAVSIALFFIVLSVTLIQYYVNKRGSQ